MVKLSSGIAVIDLESSKVMFPQGDAIKCEKGHLLLIGKPYFRAEACLPPNSVSCDGSKALVDKLNACQLIGEIINVLDDMIGSWAVIYYREDFKKVLLGRDIFGRKSLLWKRVDTKFYFSIFVCDRQRSWYDVPSGTVTVLDLCNKGNTTIFHVFEASGPWVEQFNTLCLVERKLVSERFIPSHELGFKNVNREDMAKIMLKQLKEAVHRTVSNLDVFTKSISLSFSGGVDSLLIAHLMAHCMPQNVIFDLVNVAFDKGENYDGAPDRPQSKKAFKYLKSCYPELSLRLLLVNVDLNELVYCRKKFISSAVAPACCVLDDSIGCVQWFAARGEGLLFEDEEKPFVPTKSEAGVVFVGSGADELFGGYMRHRTTYLKKGRNAVVEELRKELSRIGERNLGRDDRVVSSLGKDLKSPFLDDLFVEWVNSLPLECKTDFTQPRGIGEKWLVRDALKILGTPQSLCLTPKRAMQFGTRIAKLENRGERGNDICLRLLEE
ncbi:asparagine synthetase domain-containing protein 1 [Loa loa]|uniref:Asparagine synthetase domain-containing protein 1 n=1 Tax=Loa loa TaxID=7209 RepID=A0A1I7W189_LOALO|nr:asparagine synthetase domain-containing protein 1 [Loa loa]EJD75112.1 asparagine synthetase domain-containing protein 1 [Loa loa]